MSIFAGIAAGYELRVPSADLAKLTLSVAAYGVGDPRRWTQEGTAIVHSQSVITCEDEREQQPSFDPDSGLCLAFDGRLDNRSDLIRRLDLAPNVPDSDIIAAAVRRWDDRAPEMLLGDFAFACWNTRARKLLLASDQTGGRVIFYAQQRHRIVFATMVNTVRDLLGRPPVVDENAVAGMLLDRGIAPTRTLYADIARLPPAGLLCWTPDSGTTRRYWKPDPGRKLRFRRDQDYIEAGREALDRAVRSCLRSKNSVAAALSGGLDSGGVAATAARLMGAEILPTITAVPQPGAPLPARTAIIGNEWPLASSTAKMHANIVAHAAPAGGLTPYEVNPDAIFRLMGSTPRNSLNSAWLHPFRQQARALGSSVLLTGVAGNLTLSWDGLRALADYARQGRWLRMSRDIWACRRAGGPGVRSLFWDQVVTPLTPVQWRGTLRRWRKNTDAIWSSSSPIHPEFARSINLADQLMAGERLDIMDVHGGDFALRASSLEYFWSGRANLASLRPLLGYEPRDPLGDLRLVEFCLSLPPEQYMRNGVRRRFARRVLSDRLPTEVLTAKRLGRQCPEWFHRLSRRRQTIQEDLASLKDSPLASRFVDLQRLQGIVSDWPADADAAEVRFSDLVLTLVRGYEIGRLLRWVEGC